MSRFDTTLGPVNARAQQRIHGETVTYTPDGGSATEIKAVVFRGEREVGGPDGGAMEWAVEIEISKADVPKVVHGGDTVVLKRRASDSTNIPFRVVQVFDGDGGMWRLGLTVS